MEVNEVIFKEMWARLGEPLEGDPIVVRSDMHFTIQTVVGVGRTSDDLVTMSGSIEWNSGTPVITSHVFARVPLGTVAYIADEWREQVGG